MMRHTEAQSWKCTCANGTGQCFRNYIQYRNNNFAPRKQSFELRHGLGKEYQCYVCKRCPNHLNVTSATRDSVSETLVYEII